MLSRLDVSGPRYTSYPTADRFVEAFGPDQYATALSQRASAVGGAVMPLSVYVHIPFCESVCYYCACNKVITKHHERAAEYLDALQREIDLHVSALGRGQSLSQLHFGGGSPTFLTDDELRKILALLVDQLNVNLQDRRMKVIVAPDVADWIIDITCKDRSYGARPLRRAIQRYIEDPLAEELIRGHLQGGEIEVYLEGGQLAYRPACR